MRRLETRVQAPALQDPDAQPSLPQPAAHALAFQVPPAVADVPQPRLVLDACRVGGDALGVAEDLGWRPRGWLLPVFARQQQALQLGPFVQGESVAAALEDLGERVRTLLEVEVKRRRRHGHGSRGLRTGCRRGTGAVQDT
jgi:hypothetical protein